MKWFILFNILSISYSIFIPKYELKHPQQIKYNSYIESSKFPIVIATGLPGTGKTMIGCHTAIKLFKEGKYKKIIITRPIVSVDEDLGYLPGTLQDKMNPFLFPIYDYFLDYFTKEMQNRRVRPSVFLPLWHVLGYALGAGTAALGKNAAMVCTEAVEEVIDQHYQEQLKQLDSEREGELLENIEKFRQEEVEHQHIAKENMRDLNLGHRILYNAVKLGCKISIGIAKKF